jgi:hypothetical protein
MKREIFYGRYNGGGPMALPRGSLKFTADGRHEVHVNGGPVAELDGKELKDYFLCQFGGSGGTTAKQRFEALCRRYAVENSINMEAAIHAVGHSQEGRKLWEQARMEELAETARSGK